MKNEWRVIVGVCALVVGVYAYAAHEAAVTQQSLNAAGSFYNLLVQGFRAGQLNLKKEVPTGFAHLADPYDPAANQFYMGLPYWIGDLSYYKGKLYLYWGITPALILFWPFVALTGHYLSHRLAVLVFCAIGFLASVGVLYAVWRRHFSELSVWVVAAGTLALGLTTPVPVILLRSDVYEVAISCAYMLTMLSLGAIWHALHEPERRCWWLGAASLACGLAVGARPTLLFGAIILLVPVFQAWRDGRRAWTLLVAAITPIALIGLGLMLYNALRFNNPFEFGLHYQLAGERQVTRQFFNLHYLWFNFRVYFLEPARWSGRFPFVHDISVPPVPAGYGWVEHAFGVLTNIPLAWLALAVPLAWRGRGGPTGSVLRGFVLAVALLFGMCALTLALCCWAALRYEVDFLPALLLLAVVGILSLERVLSDRPVWRRSVRWGWGLLLGFSVAFNLLASVEGCAEAHKNWGVALELAGKMQDAMKQYEQALRIRPGDAEAHNHLGAALMRQGKLQEAIAHFEQALLLKTDDAEAHNNLGAALMGQGKLQEAIAHFEQAVRITPDDFKMQYNLGIALGQAGRTPEAIEHYQQALKLRPDFTAARNALARLQARQ
ncbi:MAG: tetratricopeptide repeat protein [Verrucomicrobiia bacterium]